MIRLLHVFTAALIVTGLVLSSTLAFASNANSRAQGKAPATEVLTKYGLLEGQETSNSLILKGIPYAAPPVGSLRWQAPQPPKAWTTPLAATAYGSVCPQNQIGDKSKILGSEDCLFMNVFRPKSVTHPLPVMFFIHGGGNTIGSASDGLYGTQLYDGTNSHKKMPSSSRSITVSARSGFSRTRL